jgi:predicted transcriptional regulator
MGAIKENNYTDHEFEIAHLFDAIGHPARKRIIEILNQHNFHKNIDLAEYLNLSPACVMNHLNKLKRADLVSIRYDVHYYEIRLNKIRLKKIAEYIHGIME